MKKYAIRLKVTVYAAYFKTFEAEDPKDAVVQAKLDLSDQTPEAAGWECDEREAQHQVEWVEEID